MHSSSTMESTTNESAFTDLPPALDDLNQGQNVQMKKHSEDIDNPQPRLSSNMEEPPPQPETSTNADDIIIDVEGNDGVRTACTNRSDDCSLGNGEPDYLTRPCFTQHLGKHRQYWRDMILGVNDGLVSTFLLVAGVSGGGLSSVSILLTGISGGVAGAVSMAAGEFMATRSQDEVFQGEIKLEKCHIEKFKSDELLELKDLLARIGIEVEKCPALQRRVIDYYRNNDEALLKAMVALEFGCIDEERRLAWKASAYSFFCFIVGSLPSIIPFAFTAKPLTGLLISGVATSIGLLIVGMVKTWATRGNCIRAALENLLVALGGGAAAYGIGLGFEKIT